MALGSNPFKVDCIVFLPYTTHLNGAHRDQGKVLLCAGAVPALTLVNGCAQPRSESLEQLSISSH